MLGTRPDFRRWHDEKMRDSSYTKSKDGTLPGLKKEANMKTMTLTPTISTTKPHRMEPLTYHAETSPELVELVDKAESIHPSEAKVVQVSTPSRQPLPFDRD